MSTDRLLPLLLMAVCIRAQTGCGPLEEDASTTLTCGSSCASGELLSWRADIDTVISTVGRCQENACGLLPGYSNYLTVSPPGSTLTINRVSRSDPFNMETRWTCQCGGHQNTDTVCGKLQVYALPENPECTVSEVPGSGDISSVTVSCSTTKVYPQAKCRFESKINGGNRIRITVKASNSQPLPGVSPVYYSSSCSVSVSVSELGEGTHSFQGYIYPDVTAGGTLVNVIEPSKTVTLSVPATSHSCSTDMVQGYFRGKSASCTCRLTPGGSGNPRGTAGWYQGDAVQIVESDGSLSVTYQPNNPEQVYTCEGVSALGRKVGSTLTAKFAFIEPDSVEVNTVPSTVNLCGSTNNTQVLVTCQVSLDDVSPAPTFSLSLDGSTFETPVSGTNTGTHYQRQFYPNPTVGGEYQVTCRVTNTVLPNTRQESQTTVIFRQPPPFPPQVTLTVKGETQTYQGVDPSNTVTLTEGYTGDVTCRVEGGYPDANNTQLKCGNLEGSAGGKTSTLSFTSAPLTRDMDGTVCTCTSQHDSGCYSNRETTLTLNLIYPPEVNFNQHPPKSQPLREGDNLELTCSVQGKPDPTSVTLTRERTSEVLRNVQTTKLTHTIDPLSCLDTGVYICSGQNSQGPSTLSISVEVLCPQRFLPSFDAQPVVCAAIGETAHIDLEIYGFPEPRGLTLLKVVDSTDLTSSPRHSVKYTAREAPLGFVNVTISDVRDTDFTNYTLTVDNGEGEALTYSFYLYEVKATIQPTEGSVGESGDVDGVAIGVGVGIAVLVILVVVVVVMLLRKRGSSLKTTNKRHRPNQYVMFERNWSSNANVTPSSANLPPSTNHYEQMDGDFGLPATSTNHYDEITDLRVAPSPQHVVYLTPTSGLYNTPSPQDTKPPGIYSRQRPVASPSEDHQASGPHNNNPGQLGENPDVGVISETKENTVTALPGANYANVTMTTENAYVDAMSEPTETIVTAVTGANYTNVTIATASENKQNNDGSGRAYENVDLN